MGMAQRCKFCSLPDASVIKLSVLRLRLASRAKFVDQLECPAFCAIVLVLALAVVVLKVRAQCFGRAELGDEDARQVPVYEWRT